MNSRPAYDYAGLEFILVVVDYEVVVISRASQYSTRPNGVGVLADCSAGYTGVLYGCFLDTA